MRILVLGGTGFIGSVIAKHMNELNLDKLVIGARHPESGAPLRGAKVKLDATDDAALSRNLSNVDVIINCVTGSGPTIRKNASALVRAVRQVGRPIRLIYLSSMAVYGGRQGTVDETPPPSSDGNWYGQAKIDAEKILTDHANRFESCTILRPGCVYGPHSTLWVDRIGLLLRRGRLGDLGPMGDGWSNLVHVNDVATAVVRSLDSIVQGPFVYNLAAPDSPRWNNYFRDFAVAIGAVPFKYKTRFSILLESNILAPPLKLLERLSDKGLIRPHNIPSIPPSLVRLWSRQLKLDSSKATNQLHLQWTPYPQGLADSVEHFNSLGVS